MGEDHVPRSDLKRVSGVGDTSPNPDSEPDDPTVSLKCCDLYASFEITPDQGCVLSSIDPDMTVLQHSFNSESCEVLLEADNDSTEIMRGGTIDTAVCPLLLMSDYEASSVVREVTDDGFIVDAYLSDPDAVWNLIDDLKEVTEQLTVRRIVDMDEVGDSPIQASIDLGELTDKQREALSAAIREGYFERPRRISQAELAEQFDISKQAMARRLARAERAVFGQLPLG
jgi:predicted DNA binding protein